ncbi:MAG TPA: uracil-DNA glycosylase [Candidatus Doudnabacteria bacterium]|nr:uracil-DNA glycosylase [Candidatus Doudnabacteria bacterium]
MTKSAKATLLEKEAEAVLLCRFCKKNSKGALVPGEGPPNAKIIFIGEAPGKNEVLTGKPFIGRAGKVLDSLIALAGQKREKVFITSAVKYLPKNYITPKPEDIKHGRKHLFAQLDIIKPKLVVLLGNVAVQAVLGRTLPVAQHHGTVLQENGQAYFISYHPAAPLYSPKLKTIIEKDFKDLKKLL